MYFQLSVSFLLLYLLKSEAAPCNTSYGEQGECVFIGDCPVLAKLFANPINGTVELLIKYKCEPYLFHVCCSRTWNFTNYGEELSDRRFCGYQHTDDYFPTGNTTSIDEFPWLAAIVRQDQETGEDKIACHGSLINNRYILSAADCFKDPFDEDQVWKVLLGKYHAKNKTSCVDLEGYGPECTEVQEYGMDEIYIHPFYYISYYYDLCNIALIRLNKTTSYTDYIRPICLPTQGTKFAEAGEILYTTGWRGIYFGETSAVKKKIKTILVTSEECEKIYEGKKTLSIYNICTRDLVNYNTQFLCYEADRSAPVMFSYRNQWHLEGIVVPRRTCDVKYPAIHTRVAPFIDWIKQIIRP